MSSESEKAMMSVEDAEKVPLKESKEMALQRNTDTQSSANSNPPSSDNTKKSTYRRPFSVFTNDTIDLEPLITSGVSFLSVSDG